MQTKMNSSDTMTQTLIVSGSRVDFDPSNPCASMSAGQMESLRRQSPPVACRHAIVSLRFAMACTRSAFLYFRAVGLGGHLYGPNGEDKLAQIFDEIEGSILSLEEIL